VDQRVRTAEVRAESALTRDTVPVNVDAIVFWLVWSAEKSILEVMNFEQAIGMSAQTAQTLETMGVRLRTMQTAPSAEVALEMLGVKVTLQSPDAPFDVGALIGGPRNIEEPMSLADLATHSRRGRPSRP